MPAFTPVTLGSPGLFCRRAGDNPAPIGLMGVSGAIGPAIKLTSEVLHLAADGPMLRDSNGVNTWLDTSVSGTNFVQATNANKPQYNVNSYNNLPSLHSAGLASIQNGSTALASPGTMIVVLTPSSVGAGNYSLAGSSGSVCCIIQQFIGSDIEFYNNPDRQVLTTTPTAGLHVLIVTQTDASSLIGYWDGTSVFSVTPTVALAPIRSVFSDIGISGPMIGDIAEVISLNVALSAPNVALYYAWLKKKWGTP